MTQALPRGVRNKNPFNIRKNPADKWQGLSAAQNDPDFWQFDQEIYGIRAGMRNLIAAQDKHSRHTVNEIIFAFAPPSENNTRAYIDAVCQHMGVSQNDPISMHDYSCLRSISEAIIAHENGAVWTTFYADAQMTKAAVLAGVEPPKRSLAQSAQIVGGSIAAGATVAGPVISDVQQQLAPLTDYSAYIKYAFVALALIGIIVGVVAKINERKKGIS